MTQAAALYFQDEFDQSTESAAAIASIFGWMNLFARGVGGFYSDMANVRLGFRGRLWCQVFMLVCEGLLAIAFSYTHQLGTAILAMCLFSISVQAAEGSTFGIVPYVDTTVTGSVAGIVGAGGNVGGVCFALLFRALDDDRSAFLWMGCSVLACSICSLFVTIPGHRGLVTGADAPDVIEHRRRAKIPEVVVLERSTFIRQQQDHHHSRDTATLTTIAANDSVPDPPLTSMASPTSFERQHTRQDIPEAFDQSDTVTCIFVACTYYSTCI